MEKEIPPMFIVVVCVGTGDGFWPAVKLAGSWELGSRSAPFDGPLPSTVDAGYGCGIADGMTDGGTGPVEAICELPVELAPCSLDLQNCHIIDYHG